MSVAHHQQPVKEVKVRRKKWTRDDTELSILALPTSLWYLIDLPPNPCTSPRVS